MKYKKNELEEIVKDCLSIAEVCRRLNIRPLGGNYKTLKKHFKMFDIDISHFTGKAWNVGKRYRNFGKVYTIEEILVENSTYTNLTNLKKRLIDNGLKLNKCEICGINSWNNKILILHLDHINGDNLDNRIGNLRMLCPNCHSQTDTYCNSKIKSEKSDLRIDNYNDVEQNKIRIKEEKKVKIKKINKCSCGKIINSNSKSCAECYSIIERRRERPNLEQLEEDVKNLGYVKTGKKYGVSDNSIRKWIKYYKNV